MEDSNTYFIHDIKHHAIHFQSEYAREREREREREIERARIKTGKKRTIKRVKLIHPIN